jgi:hypothetical protein
MGCKKKLFSVFGTMLLAALLPGVFSCEAAGVGGKDVPAPSKSDIDVGWKLSAAPVAPDAEERAAVITFKFNKKFEDLAAGDFTFDPEDGLGFGELTPSGDDADEEGYWSWTMEVSGIPYHEDTGEIEVGVEIAVGVKKEGFLFTPSPVITWDIKEGTFDNAIAVTNLTLQASLDLAVDASATLEGTTLLPPDATNKRLKWSSDASVVARVDAKTGSITGVNPGKAVITVASVSNPGVTASCTVYVAIWETSSVGETGPGGGTVFYDKGAYIEGWRYMEIAPADAAANDVAWGLTFNGTSTPNNGDMPSLSIAVGDGLDAGDIKGPSNIYTGVAPGGYRIPVKTSDKKETGKANTLAILDAWEYANAIPTPPYLVWRIGIPDFYGLGLRAPVAAQACDDYSTSYKSDWFMPSKGELELVYTNLVKDKADHGFSGTYWSSSVVYRFSYENDYDRDAVSPEAYVVDLGGGGSGAVMQSDGDSKKRKVRAVRAF